MKPGYSKVDAINRRELARYLSAPHWATVGPSAIYADDTMVQTTDPNNAVPPNNAVSPQPESDTMAFVFDAEMGRPAIGVPAPGHRALPIPLAVARDGFLVTNGINGTDPSTEQRPEAIEGEVAQIYRNIVRVLDAAGFTPSDVLKVTFFVADRSTRTALNAGWVELFPDPGDRPARQTLVQELPPGVRLQADLLAVNVRSER